MSTGGTSINDPAGARLRECSQLPTVIAEPFQRNGEGHVVVRSGDLVRQIPERYADDYMLVLE